VLTPAEFFREGGAAHIQVVRTGATTNAASVSFATSNDTAIANLDYVPQAGTLDFAPLEVSKEVVIPLLARRGVMERIAFKVELSSPSAGYSTIPATPIVILPDVRLVSRSIRLTNGMITLRLDGTIPGRSYWLESSTNLTDWRTVIPTRTIEPPITFEFPQPSGAVQFFRARQQ
jgi:hypothetical protein